MGYKKDKLIESDESGSNILYSAYEPKDDDKDHNWEKKYKRARKEIAELNKQLATALKSMDKLIKQLAELESSKLVKFRKYFYLYLNRLRSNVKKGEKRNFFSILYNYVFKRGGRLLRLFLTRVFKSLYLIFETRKVVIIEVVGNYLATTSQYSQYLLRKKLNKDMIKQYKRQLTNYNQKPLFSIIMPVYNPRIDLFTKAIDSVIGQIYEHWELCIADDKSSDPEVRETLEKYCQADERIKVVYREDNGHISRASNSALELAVGEYAVLMDHDDILREDALYQLAKAINLKDGADLIYTDEDKIDEWGIHSEPHFKPDWCPDNLLSRNYLGHVCAFKTAQLRDVGGWRVGFEGSQDYDLVLRYTEIYNKVIHIPEVLYHWRVHSESAALSEAVKPYAYRAAQSALYEAMARRGMEATVDFLDSFRGYSIRFGLNNKNAKVSIIIPSRNKADMLRKCLRSIDKKSTYRNFEIIVIDNNSDEKEFFTLIKQYTKQSKIPFKCVQDKEVFNFSRLINLGRKNASGEFILLLNNDTEVISPDWLEAMMEHAQRKEIGVVGAKLLYDNDTIQHAGVIVGLGGAAGHVLVGEDRDGPGYFNYVNMLNTYSAVTGACFMVRKSVFDEVGGFDESFGTEYNDVDFCLKIREAGYYNLYVPHCELYHFESMSRGHPHSTSESYKKHVKEVNMFRKKWKTYIEHDPCYNPNLSLGVHNFGMK
ncbi:MAG: glycosyltransferase family 2 protein [Bacteroidales bacterium]|jgi:GT2 family glycosyltransferase|nr:glycosyltransferase family 2 protein [Bacteroidales bacterium]MDD4214885.1 glycosyltransferase family 2 protein [Bacteroidales bacterium]